MEYSISKDASQWVHDSYSISLSYYLENTRIHRITCQFAQHVVLCGIHSCLPLPYFFQAHVNILGNRLSMNNDQRAIMKCESERLECCATNFLKNCPPKTLTAWVWRACCRKYFVRSEIFWENLNYLFLSSSAFPKNTFSPYVCWAVILYYEKWVTCGRKESFSS